MDIDNNNLTGLNLSNQPEPNQGLYKAFNELLEDTYHPQIMKRIQAKSLSKANRMKQFEQFYIKKSELHQNIKMIELYTFFPECKKIGIPEHFEFSTHKIKQKGVKKFIEELTGSAKKQNFK